MTKSYSDLEDYGPGKFIKAIDEIVYTLSLHGFCDSMGDVERGGYYTFVDVDFTELPSDVSELAAQMDPDDLEFLRDQHGAIVLENNYGSVYVEYYPTKRQYLEACAGIEGEIEAAYEDEETEGDDE